MSSRKPRTIAAILEVNTKRLTRGLNKAKGAFKKYGKTVKNTKSKTDKATSKTDKATTGKSGGWSKRAKTIAKFGAVAIGAGYGAYRLGKAMYNSGKEAVGFEERILQLTTALNLPIKEADKIRKEILKLSGSFGFAKEEVIGLYEELKDKTGSHEFIKNWKKTIAETAKVTGGSLKDVSTLVYMLTQQGITDPKEMEKGLNTYFQKSLMGSLSFADVAQYGAAPLAQGSASLGKAGKGVEGTKSLGGLFQLTQRSTGNAAETMTASRTFLSRLIKKKDKLEGLGINVSGLQEGKLSMGEFMKSIGKVSQDEGSLKKLMTIFGERGIKPILGAREAYKAGWNTERKGIASGARLFDSVNEKERTIKQRYTEMETTDVHKFQKADAKIQASMHQVRLQFMKVSVRFLPIIAKLMESLARALGATVSSVDSIAGSEFSVWDMIGRVATGKGGLGSAISPNVSGNSDNQLTGLTHGIVEMVTQLYSDSSERKKEVKETKKQLEKVSNNTGEMVQEIKKLSITTPNTGKKKQRSTERNNVNR